MTQNSHDFFKDMRVLFEATETNKAEKPIKENRFAADNPEMDDEEMTSYWERKQEKADDERKSDKEGAATKALDKKKKKTISESAATMMRKYVDFITEADVDPKIAKNNKKMDDKRALAKARADLASAKTGSTEEKALTKKINSLMQIDESFGDDDDDEDPDVAKADKEKGKDGKKQSDFEKGKKKWNFEKADKKSEDKSAKKVAKDKDI